MTEAQAIELIKAIALNTASLLRILDRLQLIHEELKKSVPQRVG